jgi:DNA-binding NtrC family response regulator
MEELRRMIARIANTGITVLITGESGTGKDLVARSIHFASPRAARPFVALNCAALPEMLLETELFGVEKGVATGVDRRAGKFESAQGGTIFLDEIGDLSLAAQAKILRVLQDHVVERIGGRASVAVDVRVIAATNKDLAAAMKRAEFREDLYYRLNVVHLKTPALREMPGDIPALANALLHRISSEMKRTAPPLSPAALHVLQHSSWPGNVRQLENELRRAAIVAQGPEIEPADFSEELTTSAPEPSGRLQQELEGLEQRRIVEALAAAGNNQQRTARALGLSRQGLINKLKRYGIRTSAPRQE